jgi:uncharacterized ferritin-like protein (DUF455 family)
MDTLAAAVVSAPETAHAAALPMRGVLAIIRKSELPTRSQAGVPPCLELRPLRDMLRRARARSPAGRIVLLYALARIELSAVDLEVGPKPKPAYIFCGR